MANEYQKAWAAAKKKAEEEAKAAPLQVAADNVGKNKALTQAVMRPGVPGDPLRSMAMQQLEYEKQKTLNRPKEDLNEEGQRIAWDAALGKTRAAAPEVFGGGAMVRRDNQLMGMAAGAGQGYSQAFNAGMDGARGQRELGALIMQGAMGGGPSIAGAQGQVAGDRLIREAAGAGAGNMLAQRAAMGGLGASGVDLATQVANARASEQARRQSELAQNLRAMQTANVGAFDMASGRQLDMLGQRDADVFGNAALEQRATAANFESEEQMRARAARSQLIQMGRDEAIAAQSRANQQAAAQAAIAAGTTAANAASGLYSTWKKRDSSGKKGGGK